MATTDNYEAELECLEGTYERAIEDYRVALRAQSECEIEITVAQVLLDTDTLQLNTDNLRRVLSKRSPLDDAVKAARRKVRDTGSALVRYKGMGGNWKDGESSPGLMHQILDKLTKI